MVSNDAPAQSPKTFMNRADLWLGSTIRQICTLTGWRRYGVAFLSGIGATLAMAPYYFLPLLIIGYCVLFTLLSPTGLRHYERPLGKAFLTGWAFGFGYFLSGIYWMGFAFLVRGEEFAWMLPIAIPAFAGFLGLFFALPGLAFARLCKSKLLATSASHVSWRHGITFAALIAIFEYLRGHILTGLPWNLTGQAMVGWLAGAQTVSIYGVYGLSLIVLVLAVLPATSFRDKQYSLHGVVYSLSGFALLFLIGFFVLVANPTRYHDDVSISIVQPNIKQKDKVNPTLASQNFEKLMQISQSSNAGVDSTKPSDYLIWPENAVSWIDEQPLVMDVLERRIAPQTTIITGSVRASNSSNNQASYYNTLATVETRDQVRTVTNFYDKHHLVPFGEYLPLKGLLKAVGLSGLAPVEDGFTPGKGPETLQIGPAAFAPLICYETIFSDAIYPRRQRPQWLVTVTNDAWFGDNAGPKQHLDQAKLRTIEFGLPMARAANTGISAMLDSQGRVIAQVNLYKDGVINTALPIAKSNTIYARFGDGLFFLMVMITLIVALIQKPHKPTQNL